jgi:EmrB/QacA subfamily drug resistance transporter
MAFIDGSVVTVALPQMQRELQADAFHVQWIVNAYLLPLGALVLLGGAAGDSYGRRRVFITGIGIFALASLACAAAPDAGMLIVARAFQGLGAALLMPASLAILGERFREGERGQAIGIWAGAGGVMSAVGPVLGGWFVDSLSWRAIFVLNLPLAAGAIWLALLSVRESRDTHARSLDWTGAAMAALGLGCLTWGLTAAGERGFVDRTVTVALLSGVILLGTFLWWQARTRSPMMPLSLYRSPSFTGANLLTLLLYFGLSGALFFLPFELVRVHGYSATAAGAVLLPFSVVMGALSGLAGRAADRFGPRLPLVCGPITAGLGFALLGMLQPGSSYWIGLLPATLVMALGMTISIAPLTSTVMGSVLPQHVGIASGINNAVARIAGLLASSILGLVYFAPDGGGYRTVMWTAAGSAILAGAVGGRTIPPRKA